ncbi:S41 family peptidase [Acidicapsa ligni]|uniref:S41 family peptidase n=1 Tax=Acidicapsa ligni TaxID=542300 RepID=UPI0021E0D116|nr:S41 family peptidase [Acidicapsa ligni]
MAEEQLNRDQRSEILNMLSERVISKFYDPNLRGVDWKAAVDRHREAILSAESAESFELAVGKLLAELKTSHVGFYKQRPQRATARMAISATYSAESIEGQDRWVFQIVHEGGPGARAGLKAGDVLLSVDGRIYSPPEHPSFPLGKKTIVQVLTNEGRPVTRKLDIPIASKKRFQLPYVQPTLVVPKRIRHDIGYLRISMFPGVVGVDVANEITTAIRQLHPVNRLIIDLRGNSGGGLAVVRLMSLLTPERLPIGYSEHRSQSGMSSDAQRFPVFDSIPQRKLVLKWLTVKFGWRIAAAKLGLRVKPILLRTEGLEPKPFSKRVVLLVDRHTASASEIVAAFARENGLAVLVGEPTSGRLLSGDDFKLSGGYRVALPVGVYRTAHGWVLEGSPVEPDVHVPFDSSAARSGADPQLERAVEVVSTL